MQVYQGFQDLQALQGLQELQVSQAYKDVPETKEGRVLLARLDYQDPRDRRAYQGCLEPWVYKEGLGLLVIRVLMVYQEYLMVMLAFTLQYTVNS